MIEFQAYLDREKPGGLRFVRIYTNGDADEHERMDTMRNALGAEEDGYDVDPILLLALVALGRAEIEIDGQVLCYTGPGGPPDTQGVARLFLMMANGYEPNEIEKVRRMRVIVRVELPMEE